MASAKGTKQAKIVVVYTRVSTGDQAREGLSLVGQADRGKALAAAHFPGHQVEVVQDIGSGTSDRRPGYRSMMAAVAGGRVLGIVVVDLDRLARNVGDAVKLLDALQARGVALVAQGQGLDTSSPMGRLFAVQILAFAEFESRMISRRVLASQAVGRALGRKGPGLRPWGWRIQEDGTLARDPDEQRGIDLASNERLRGSAWERIAQLLNDAGFRPVKAAKWSKASARSATMAALDRRQVESRAGSAVAQSGAIANPVHSRGKVAVQPLPAADPTQAGEIGAGKG
jgi:DNA invertase Pin-like site-specific DNA recombinase